MQNKGPLFRLLAMLLLFGCSVSAFAQLPYGILDLSNIKMGVSSNGCTFYLPPNQSYQFETPKDSSTSTIYASNLWLGAIDGGGILRMAAQTDNQFGADYWAGPINPNTGVAANPSTWNKVWKVNRSVIDYHIEHYADANYSIPNEIAAWPGNGSAGFSPIMAPFVDLNGNGQYESWLGDHPNVKGDQALYFIFNDKFQSHGHTAGLPLGVEIHGMAFCYNNVENYHLKNTIFVRYKVVNRNVSDVLNSLYFGVYTDFDIGYYGDDYVGSDTLRNMYYGYNSDAYDSTGAPGSETFGWSPPAQAVVFLNRPMTNSLYYVNDQVPNGNPSAPEEYYNYLKSIWRDSTHLNYWGDGYMDSSAPVDHSFTGNPATGTGWTESNAGNLAADRRMLGSTGPYSVAPGQFLQFDIAYVYARSNEGNLGSIIELNSAVDEVRWFYTYNVGVEEQAAITKNRASKELDPFMLDDAYFSALLAAARHDAESDVGRGVTRLDRYAKTVPDGAHLKDVSDWQKRLRGEMPSLLDKTKDLNAP